MLKLNSSVVAFLMIDLITCNAMRTAERMKNGILILVMNGCTMTVALVIISCQYKVNNKYDEIANGKQSSISV